MLYASYSTTFTKRKTCKNKGLKRSEIENNLPNDEEQWVSDDSTSDSSSENEELGSDGEDEVDFSETYEKLIPEEEEKKKKYGSKRNVQQFQKDSFKTIPKKTDLKRLEITQGNSSDESKKDLIKWDLTNYKDSCRYSTFLTLYRLKLFYSHSSFSTKSESKESVWLNKLISINENISLSTINSTIKESANYNFQWNFEMDEYGEHGSITPLFRIFQPIKFCDIEVKDTKKCSHCNFIQSIDTLIRPPFSLSGKELVGKGIEAGIKSCFNPAKWTCECCGLQSKTLTRREVIKLPKFLFLVLNLTFRSLSRFKKHKETIEFEREQYVLCSAVTKPIAAHFALLLKDPIRSASGWYEYDDLIAGGNIVLIEDDILSLLAARHAYVLIYQIVPRSFIKI